MAKNDQTGAAGAAPAAEAAKEPELTKDQVAKLIAAEVLVPVFDSKTGAPIVDVDPELKTRRYRTQKVRARAEHIHSFRVDGKRLVATTVDGQKHEAALA